MKIKFEYTLKTNSNFILRNADKFGCTDSAIVVQGQYYDYIGSKEFCYYDVVRCKEEARAFLAKFLCEGICVLFSHYMLTRELYDKVDALIQFVDNNDSGEVAEVLTGDYEGTTLKITIYEDVTPTSEMTNNERITQLRIMHKFMTNSNDEELYMQWVAGGVPDCPSDDDFENIAGDDELYSGCCNLFTDLVQKDGWQYGAVSKKTDVKTDMMHLFGEKEHPVWAICNKDDYSIKYHKFIEEYYESVMNLSKNCTKEEFSILCQPALSLESYMGQIFRKFYAEKVW